MISKNTVLIIGAGGSCAYGFPSGQKLIEIIRNNLNDELKNHELHEAGITDEEILIIKKIILPAKPNDTIDRIIESNAESNPLGKIKFPIVCRALIAQALIPFEDENQLNNINDWYDIIFESMFVSISVEDFSKNKIAFITFNYDRSFEHKLFLNLKKKCGLGADSAAEIMNSYNVIHLYFRLGYLDWEIDKDGKAFRNYNPAYSNNELKIAAAQFMTISEPIENTNFEIAHKLIKDAGRIYFAGFGFDETNFVRLKIAETNPGAQLFGTCYNKNSTDIALIENMTGQKLQYKNNLLNCKTGDLFIRFPLNN